MIRSPRHLLLLAALAAATPAAAIQFVSSLSSVQLEAQPGEVHFRDFRLRLTEESDGALFRIKLEDWWQSADGRESHYEPAGTLRRSCAKWVEADPLEATVTSGGELLVTLGIRVPDELPSGGYWCVLTVDEVADPRKAPEGVGVQFSASISTGIFVDVGAVRREARITAVDLDGVRAAVRVENTGDVPVGVEGRLDFFVPDGGELVGSVPFARVTALPEPVRDKVLTAELPSAEALPSGRYLVRAVIDYGAEHLIGVQRLVDLTRAAR